jgi:lipopolysaccharide/colanic/teichoic acid biosynthesis glycosyltransferase/glycosyltransferase involved in cell wall biosynthesis/ribosomal protein S18 acetylase RimI-like enzyme
MVANGVTRLDTYRCPASRLVGRARESWDFGRHATRWMSGTGKGRFDVVYANVWPLFGPHHLVRAAQALGLPLVMHVQDVYPESLATKLPPWLYGLGSPVLKAWDRAIARRCAAVVLLSDRIGRAYARSRGIEGKVQVVRNWFDTTPFELTYDRADVCREYDVPPDRFTFMFLGNLSALSALDTAIRAFASIADETRQFVIVGEGSLKAYCLALVRALNLGNVLFRSEPDAAKVARVQAMADVLVLPTRKGAAVSSTPSKCIAYMLSAKPILAAVDADSDTADDLARGGCGWVVPPEDVQGISAAMRTALSTPPAERAAMGAHGRAYALATFGRDTCVERLVSAVCAATRAQNGAHQRDACAGQTAGAATVTIRAMGAGDSLPIAVLHLAALRTRLEGVAGRHLLSAYYRALARKTGGVGYVAVAPSGALAGFVCGVWDRGALRRTLMRRECAAVLGWALLHAAIVPRWTAGLCSAFLRRARHRGSVGTSAWASGYELRPLAVDSAYRGQGVADKLVARLLQDAAFRGFDAVFLSTEVDNAPANRFYVKRGFAFAGTSGGYNRYRIAAKGNDEIPTAVQTGVPCSAWGVRAKQTVEWTLATVGLVLVVPLLAVLAVLVKVTSPGPILYVSDRLGRGGRVFRLLKFRSMRMNAPAMLGTDGKVLTLKRDPRLTPIGRFLRLGFDELPQLLNVVKGDMCLIGPRPDLPRELGRYTERQRTRLDALPGITGLAQVVGGRYMNNAQNYELDALYVERRTWRMDLTILLLTLPYSLGLERIGARVFRTYVDAVRPLANEPALREPLP